MDVPVEVQPQTLFTEAVAVELLTREIEALTSQWENAYFLEYKRLVDQEPGIPDHRTRHVVCIANCREANSDLWMQIEGKNANLRAILNKCTVLDVAFGSLRTGAELKMADLDTFSLSETV